jgi:hypothetical protein
MTDEPDPPESLPSYVVDGVRRQEPDALRDLAAWARQLAEHRERALDQDEIDVADDEELVDVQDGSSGTILKKKVPCGKDACSQCPHGPYRYRYYRDGDKVKSEYLGTA